MNPAQNDNVIGHEENMEVAKRQVDYNRILKELAVAKAYLLALEADPKTVLKKFLEGKDVEYVRMINHTYQLKKATHAEAIKAVDAKIKEFTAKKNKKDGVPAAPAAPPAAAKETKEMECQTDPQEDEDDPGDFCPGFKPEEYTEARKNIQHLRMTQYNQLVALTAKYNALLANLKERDWLDDVNSELEDKDEHKEIITVYAKPPDVKEMDTWEKVAEDVKRSSGIWKTRMAQIARRDAAIAKAKEEKR
jgi:hypothetical protein